MSTTGSAGNKSGSRPRLVPASPGHPSLQRGGSTHNAAQSRAVPPSEAPSSSGGRFRYSASTPNYPEAQKMWSNIPTITRSSPISVPGGDDGVEDGEGLSWSSSYPTTDSSDGSIMSLSSASTCNSRVSSPPFAYVGRALPFRERALLDVRAASGAGPGGAPRLSLPLASNISRRNSPVYNFRDNFRAPSGDSRSRSSQLTSHTPSSSRLSDNNTPRSSITPREALQPPEVLFTRQLPPLTSDSTALTPRTRRQRRLTRSQRNGLLPPILRRADSLTELNLPVESPGPWRNLADSTTSGADNKKRNGCLRRCATDTTTTMFDDTLEELSSLLPEEEEKPIVISRSPLPSGSDAFRQLLQEFEPPPMPVFATPDKPPPMPLMVTPSGKVIGGQGQTQVKEKVKRRVRNPYHSVTCMAQEQELNMDFFKNISSKFTKREAPAGQGADWEWEDHVMGTLYGNCVGDAIGLLTEFMERSEAIQYYGKFKTLEYDQKVSDGHRDHWEVGDWTDDTDQMMLILLSLLDNEGKVEPTDFAKRMLAWKYRGFPECGDTYGHGLGATTNAVLTHPEFTTNPHQVSEDVWEKNLRMIAPNGGVMRTSVLGLFQYDDMVKVVQNTLDMCRVTHHDHRCRASCVAVTSAIAMMLQRRPQHLMENGEYDVKAIIHDSFQLALRCLPDKDGLPDNDAIALLRYHMYAASLGDLELGELGKIGYTYKCMGAGFWALRQTDFRKALSAIVFEAGDADTNGAVAGALLGCKLGLRNIPESWVSGLKYKDWANEKFQRYISLINSDKDSRTKASKGDDKTTASEAGNRTISSEAGHTTASSKAEEPAVPVTKSEPETQ